MIEILGFLNYNLQINWDKSFNFLMSIFTGKDYGHISEHEQEKHPHEGHHYEEHEVLERQVHDEPDCLLLNENCP